MKSNLVVFCFLALMINLEGECQENLKIQDQNLNSSNSVSFFKDKTENELSRAYIPPMRIMWKSDSTNQYITNEQVLLKKGNGQADLEGTDLMMLKSINGEKPSLLLDFGKELHGGIRIVTSFNNTKKPVKLRIRLGESVSEAMAIGPYAEFNATNDHAIRDFEIEVPWLGKIEIGDSGFRFARIDLIQDNVEIKIKEINAVLVYRDIPYLGSFESDNDRLNQIWQTGAYTVHLNMQDYLWDGIKRDRLVWLGDMHPEVMTIGAVFGNNNIVPKTLDFARDITKLPKWINGISSYSMWWVIIQYQWYYNYGNLEYLKEQKQYLKKLLELLISKTENGKETLNGHRFLDWPTQGNSKAIHTGLQSLLIMTLEQGSELCDVLGEKELAQRCKNQAEQLIKHVPDHNNIKQAAALMALSGISNPEEISNQVLLKNGAKGISAFYGYYVLQALAKSNNYTEAMDIISTYWGGMLDMGATTFWEEFELEEKSISYRIDELPKANFKNYHAETGAHCYVGYRRSLCHGWASGPTAWLSEHVLGIKILEPGMKKIAIEPHLGDLKWVKGSYPTPYGVIKVYHKRMANGEIESKIEAPKEIILVD